MTKLEKLENQKQILFQKIEKTETELEKFTQENSEASYRVWKETQKIPSVGKKLEKKQDELQYLKQFLPKLNTEITKLRKKSRVEKIRGMEKRIKEIDKERTGKLLKRKKKLQKEILQLESQGKLLRDKKYLLEPRIIALKQEKVKKYFKLNDSDSFLDENYIENPPELQKEVTKFRKRNADLLNPDIDTGNLPEKFVISLKLTIQQDSGKILKMEKIEKGRKTIENNAELREKILPREVI